MMKRPMRGSIRIVLALLLLVLPRVVEEAGAQEAVRQVTLEEALSLAERNNPALEQSASSVEIAGYQELTAW
ncbi:MAG: hypothetical protein Q8W45_10085, partial [Candidatus Palauibacterales bacterium]|nr:hypothetical protein [Candidatus Palauibacterales bacterium]